MSQAQDYADVHRRSQTRLHALADALADDAFNRKPAPDAWSVGECVEHLNRVADGYLAVIEPAVAAGARRAEGPFEYGFLARKLSGAVRPGGPALTTSAPLDPSAGGARSSIDKAAALAAFDGGVERYVAACERAEGLDLRRIKVRYPFGPLLRLPLGAALQFTGLHALRHVAQAERAAASG